MTILKKFVGITYNMATQGYTVSTGTQSTATYNGGGSWSFAFIGGGTTSSLYIYQQMTDSFTINLSFSYTPNTSIQNNRLTYYLGSSVPSFLDTTNNNPQNQSAGWTVVGGASSLSLSVTSGYYFGMAYSGAGGVNNVSSVVITNMPNADGTIPPSCFVKGTMIRIIDENNLEKDLEIEKIKIGDNIKTLNSIIPVKYIYKNITNKKDLFCVIEKNSIENNIPSKDLFISKNHGLLFDKNEYEKHLLHKIIYNTEIDNMRKINAKHCNKYKSILEDIENIEYYNIALDSDMRHCIFANNMHVESMRPILKINQNV